jgi:7,8-dihydropterin-6-yl-methyl-4-(beta-D-ribofuranosyl)aminobenzene 5'-phosphate synthase
MGAYNRMKVTIIYDNNPDVEGLCHGFGFSCLLEYGINKIIFDTGGDKTAFFYNIDKLQIKLDSITHILFSHQHWDHTAGFKEVIARLSPECKIYVPFKFDQNLISQISNQANLEYMRNTSLISKDIFSIVLKGTSCVVKECFSVYEQSLIIRTPPGLVIFTGCAHPGIKNILRRVREEFSEPICWVIGGFHLHRSFNFKIINIINYFNSINITNIAPCHCTGKRALKLFKELFKGRVISVGTGSQLGIDS